MLRIYNAVCMAFCFLVTSLSAELAKTNDIEIWYETFGEKESPALLLIMGGCCQGVLWPVDFCEQLASNGFYVIRYDHRDCGFSSPVDYSNHPYGLFDMAKDAIGLLEDVQISKAHVVGISMGGPIAELMAVHFPERIATITLISTSSDFRPLNRGLAGLPPESGLLSPPSESYLKAMEEILEHPPESQKEVLEQRIATWHLLNGSIFPLEEGPLRNIQQQFLSRLRHPEGMQNHILAIKNSEQLIKTVPHQVTIPTLIIHGTEDPIFQPDHGAALAGMITGSKYRLVEGLGHVPNPYFFQFLVQEIKEHAKDHASFSPCRPIIINFIY